MISKIWRLSHLTLSIISFLFLFLASITGIILSYDAISKKQKAKYSIENLDDITLAQSISRLRNSFMEVSSLKVDDYHQVLVEALDNDGNNVIAYINPESGTIMGYPQSDSKFIQDVTALHRSLFLKETGRTIVGIASFLLLLIALTGLILFIKRQQGILNFLRAIKRDSWAQFLHTYFGRLMLIPIVIIAATGAYLSVMELHLLADNTIEPSSIVAEEGEVKKVEAFTFFNKTTLADVVSIEFPFDASFEDFFVVTTPAYTASISQVTGDIIDISKQNRTYGQWKDISTLLHTGRTSVIWAIVLGLACLGILMFIYTGFKITFKRLGTKGKQMFDAESAEIVLLLGTENGTTGEFAKKILHQLLAQDKKAYLANMNAFQSYPNAEYLIILTATYGDGEAPNTASNFMKKLASVPQNHKLKTSVVAFGSSAYPDFCAFGKQVFHQLSTQEWCDMLLPISTINDRDLNEFTDWVASWSQVTNVNLISAPSYYSSKLKGFESFTVCDIQYTTEDVDTFVVCFKPESTLVIQSGDLLAIYPEGNQLERLYSIAWINDTIHLVVKLHPYGKGSQYLHNLKFGDTIKARIIKNTLFYFPEKEVPVVLIANGTGIAPFLGMVHEHEGADIRLFAGFKAPSRITGYYDEMLQPFLSNNDASKYNFAYSRVAPKQYVMDLIKQQEDVILEVLKNNGVIMICGSKNMQKDVEAILSEWMEQKLEQSLVYYKEHRQVRSDCY
jgi:sulfite reductase (NADPH) flavoprotein alpha-component